MTIVFLFLFPASVSTGHTGARVSQSPRHRVTERGQEVLLSCDPISGHDVLYWYRQTLGQGPEFLIYFVKKDVTDRSGMPNDRFSATRSGIKNSTLTIQRAEPGDSAVYLCASSKATARHSHLLPAHKPRAPLPLPLLETLPGPFVALRSPEMRRSGHRLCFESRRRPVNPRLLWPGMDVIMAGCP